MKPFRGKRKRPESTHGEIHALPRARAPPRRDGPVRPDRRKPARRATATARVARALPAAEGRTSPRRHVATRWATAYGPGRSPGGLAPPGPRVTRPERPTVANAGATPPYRASEARREPGRSRGRGPSVRVRGRPAVELSKASDGRRRRSATLQLRALVRPVLKHGPRSLTCARVIGLVLNPKAK